MSLETGSVDLPQETLTEASPEMAHDMIGAVADQLFSLDRADIARPNQLPAARDFSAPAQENETITLRLRLGSPEANNAASITKRHRTPDTDDLDQYRVIYNDVIPVIEKQTGRDEDFQPVWGRVPETEAGELLEEIRASEPITVNDQNN